MGCAVLLRFKAGPHINDGSEICATSLYRVTFLAGTILLLQDLFLYYSFALVLQLAVFMLYLSKASQHPHNAATVINHVGATLVGAAPTGIPTVIITSILRCVTELEKHGITVQSTLKIKDAAAVEVVVLDKTGTITGSVVSCCSL